MFNLRFENTENLYILIKVIVLIAEVKIYGFPTLVVKESCCQ